MWRLHGTCGDGELEILTWGGSYGGGFMTWDTRDLEEFMGGTENHVNYQSFIHRFLFNKKDQLNGDNNNTSITILIDDQYNHELFSCRQIIDYSFS